VIVSHSHGSATATEQAERDEEKASNQDPFFTVLRQKPRLKTPSPPQ